jgi:hypothetical protein
MRLVDGSGAGAVWIAGSIRPRMGSGSPEATHTAMDRPLFRKLEDATFVSADIRLTVDGQGVCAEAGDSVAAVLLRLDAAATRTTPVQGSARAPYCMMGVCFECLAVVDGVASTQSCLVPVREGMRVERQRGRRPVATLPDANGGEGTEDASTSAATETLS